MTPRVSYARSHGSSIAYRDYGGEGPLLLQINNSAALMDLGGSPPRIARNLERLTRFSRLVCMDKRGVGRSDRVNFPVMHEAHASDIEAVRLALGVDSFVLLAHGGGVPIALGYAAAHPSAVTHLIVMSGMCCDSRHPKDFGSGNRRGEWDQVLHTMTSDYTRWVEVLAQRILPDGSAADQADLVEHLQSSSSPADYEALWEGTVGMDRRAALSRIEPPTLVIHSVGDKVTSISHARHIAEELPNGRLVELSSSAHQPLLDPAVAGQVLAEIEEHLTGASIRSRDRATVAVVFTDIVGSTQQQKRAGEASWREFRESFEVRTGRIVSQYRGRVVQFLGDGAHIEFPSASDALDAASQLVADAKQQEVEIRAGIHAGEVYRVGDQLFGPCVTMAARVMSKAGPSEILTTELVSGLVEGAAIEFSDAGDVELKGFGQRRLLRLKG